MATRHQSAILGYYPSGIRHVDLDPASGGLAIPSDGLAVGAAWKRVEAGPLDQRKPEVLEVLRERRSFQSAERRSNRGRHVRREIGCASVDEGPAA